MSWANALAREGLGRSEMRSADDVPGRGRGANVSHPGDPEVANLRGWAAGAGQQYVRWFHVAVKNAMAMRVPDAAAHCQGDLVGADERETFAGGGESAELLLQVRPVNQLHLEPSDRASVEEAVRVDQVRCGQHLDGADLLTHSLEQSWLEVDEDLDGDVLAQITRPGPHDRCPGASTENLPAFVPLAEDWIREAEGTESVLAGHPWLQFQHPLGFHDLRPR
jgi:hypothetical protein